MSESDCDRLAVARRAYDYDTDYDATPAADHLAAEAAYDIACSLRRLVDAHQPPPGGDVADDAATEHTGDD